MWCSAGAALQELQLVGGTRPGAEEKYEQERAAERSCSYQSQSPTPQASLQGKEVRESGIKLSLGGGKAFLVLPLFLTILSYFLICNKLK